MCNGCLQRAAGSIVGTVFVDPITLRVSRCSRKGSQSRGSTNQALGNKDAAICSVLSRNSGCPGECLVWRDNRHVKQSQNSTQFSQEVLWLNKLYKPAWVVDALGMGVGMGMGMDMDRDMGVGVGMEMDGGTEVGCDRYRGYAREVTTQTVSKLCYEGCITEAVEALGILVQRDCCVSKSLFSDALKKCAERKDLVLGRRVHALAVRKGYQSDTFLCNHVLRMYASHGRLQDAMDVFAEVDKPDAFTWSAIISAHVKQGQEKQAIQLYHRMCRSSVKPDGHVFVAALQACARGTDLKTGQQVHAEVLARGGEPDLFVGNGLVNMYAKCGSLEDAQKVFDGLVVKDVVTWNAMIGGYSQEGKAQEALALYGAMEEEGRAVPDSVTFVCLLQACASVGTLALEKGKEIHAQINHRGHQADVFVANSLVNMYAKCGSVEDAQRVFDGLNRKDVVTWNAMIAGYSQQGLGHEALRLYSIMQEEGIAAPDSVTFVGLLQACAGLGTTALEKGKQLHAQIKEQGHQPDVFVASSLVNMYAKCGSLEDAQRVFDGLAQKDVVTWTALIAGYSQQGMAQEALRLCSVMLEEGIVIPNSVTFVCLLQACASVGTSALGMGKQLHVQIREHGHQADVFVANSLVNMYAKCGSLEDAQRVFDGLGQKDVVTWTALIAGYSQQGIGQQALQLYSVMQDEDIAVPNSVTFVCLLQACATVGTPALNQGKQLHLQIRERGSQAEEFVASSLVNMYTKCGSLEEARKAFDELADKDVVTWTAMIAGYSHQGMGQEALHLYSAMQEEGIAVPDAVTFVCLLQACASFGTTALEKGKQIHAQIRQRGHQADVCVASSLVNMYAKCGSLADAQRVFDRLGQKEVATWNAMIAGYSQKGMGQEALHLYSVMQEDGIAVPNSVTFVCLLQACASLGTPALEMGKQLHAQIRERGHQADVYITNSLVNMYAKCGSLENAQRVFDRLGQKDVVTWNAMIAGYAQQCMGNKALCLYSTMQDEGIAAPDSVTFVSLLRACAGLGSSALEKGKQLHAQIRERGLQTDVFVANSLVNMYAKCGSLEDAQSVFDGLVQKDVVTWNATIAGYSQQGMGQEALRVYSIMQDEGIAVPDSTTFVCLLQACAGIGTSALEMGKQLHVQVREQGHEADVFVASSLVNMYAKCGSLDDAQRAFDRLGKKDVVTWNAMIAGYSQQGLGHEALSLYSTMQQDCIAVPNSVTFLGLLQACANVAALHLGRQLHAQIEEQGLQVDDVIASSLINMYAKAGSMADAQQVFDALPNKDVVAWSALIAGYSCQGNSRVVFDLLQKMREAGTDPVGITFLSVLTVCSHTGLVDKGREYFEAMSKQFGITPSVEHYTCMVDLLCRAGQLDEALDMVSTMPVPPNAAVWHTLLGACRKWNNVEMGRYAFKKAVELDEQDAAAYVLMSNLYTAAQMWEQAQDLQARRTRARAWKQPGQSWWADMDGIVHSFLVGDERPLQPEQKPLFIVVDKLGSDEEENETRNTC